MVKNITNKEFESIINNENVTLVDFYASWCGPCKALAPVLDELSNEKPDLLIAKVNVDDDRDLALQFKVRSVPTMIIFKGGKEINRLVGFLPKEEILNRIKQ